MTAKIKVSIITITYNNRDGLKRTAQSVQSQMSRDYEWIIIDGASTDGTRGDFGNYANARIISEPDNGIYDAMNKGIEQSNGDYIIFMNAGDMFSTPTILDEVLGAITEKNPDLIYGDAWEQGKDGDIFYKRAKPHSGILNGLFTHHQSIFYNRAALGSLRYDTSFRIAADYDLTLRFLKNKTRTCHYIDKPICVFESGGISQKNIDTGRHEQCRSRKQNGTRLFHNTMISLRQKLASAVREVCPALYHLSKQKK